MHSKTVNFDREIVKKWPILAVFYSFYRLQVQNTLKMCLEMAHGAHSLVLTHIVLAQHTFQFKIE